MKTYIWAVDAGHEWLAVKQQELVNLNIAHKITSYSYMKGGTVYLEGDCDAAVFLDAYKAKFGHEAKTKQGKYWDRQPCRSFAHYIPPIPTGTADYQKNVRHLADYMEQRSRWMALFDPNKTLEFPLNQAGVNTIIDQLDCDLSPENLHCDGEISASQARAKYDFYSLVASELEAYCANNNLDYREPMEF